MNKFVLVLCLVLLLAGCGRQEVEPTLPETTASVTEAATDKVATEAAPTEQNQLPVVLSHEIAMLEGYVVMDEGDVRHNAGNWTKFLDACGAGESASVTVVSFSLEEAGYAYVKYDLTFDGSKYIVEYEQDGKLLQVSAPELTYSTGRLESSEEPYDSYEQYAINDVIVYADLIAEPDFEGVSEIYLHAKEGEPPVKVYSGESMQPILELLWEADYVSCEPENHAYGMKLLMTNRDGVEIVIELDLKQGYYRYGMQNYIYGDVSEMLFSLNMEQWPDSVLAEFGLNGK